VVAGLGNPGARYEETRHNLGFRVLDRLAERLLASPWRNTPTHHEASASLGGRALLLVRPTTYMNRSGEAVAPLLEGLGLGPGVLLVLHDDIDLPFGLLRIRPGGGHGGHNGIRSIIDCTGSADFARVKLGVGRPPDGVSAPDHVLAPFGAEEAKALPEFVERATEAALAVIEEGAARAMNRFNAPPTGEAS